MPEKRLFTEEELKEMGERTVDMVVKAVNEGKAEEAKRLANRMYREFTAMHDLYCDWVTALHSFIYKNYGDEALYHSFEAGCGSWLEPLVKGFYAGKDTKARVKTMVAGLRGHLQPMKVLEDDEKVTVLMEPCGSGGRMVLRGRYDEPEKWSKVEKPQALNYGRENFPMYCCHCPFQEILPIDWTGVPWAVTIPSKQPGKEPCQFLIYKDPKAVPEKYYQRIGKTKPE